MGFRQSFDTADVLRLDVALDPAPGQAVNLIKNPSGELGAWGWSTPAPDSQLVGGPGDDGYALTLTNSNGSSQDAFADSNTFEVEPGDWIAGGILSEASSGGASSDGLRIRWFDAAGDLISETPRDISSTLTPRQAPASTTSGRLRITLGAAISPLRWWRFRDVVVAKIDAPDAVYTRTNLVANPSFETGLGGWEGFGLSREAVVWSYSGDWSCRINEGFAQTVVPVTGGQACTASVWVRAAAAGTPVTLSAGSASVSATSTGTAWKRLSVSLVQPSGSDSMTVSINSPSGTIWVDGVMVQPGVTPSPYFDGSKPDTGGWEYEWTGTAHASSSTALLAEGEVPYIPPTEWLDVLGEATSIQITREALSADTLTADILSDTLDPSQSDVLRPGAPVRLATADGVPLFAGTIAKGEVAYDYRRAGPHARVQVTATGAGAALAATQRAEGVATIAELPYVLEGVEVPWDCNGVTGQGIEGTVVAVNDNASALDQVAVTRDSALGAAWVDRRGVLQVWDRDLLDTTPTELTEDDYEDIELTYSTEGCINEVRVKYLRFNPSTLETEEVEYGPWRDRASIREWGVRSAEFTIQGIAEELSDLGDFAAAVLAANATPVRRIGLLTRIMRTAEDVTDRGLVDLYDLHAVTLDGTEYTQRVTRIEHTITPRKWTIVHGYAADGAVAAPTFTPSPSTGAGGKTIGQLLRPITEVTHFLCAKADIPAGWLPLDGSTFSADEYPELYAKLGTNVLPDYTDRIPIGAGTKAVGTTGGTPAVTLAKANLPRHVHTVDLSHGHNISTTSSATGSATGRVARGTTTDTGDVGGPVKNFTGSVNSGNGGGDGLPATPDPIDVTGPWVALWLCIRAR